MNAERINPLTFNPLMLRLRMVAEMHQVEADELIEALEGLDQVQQFIATSPGRHAFLPAEAKVNLERAAAVLGRLCNGVVDKQFLDVADKLRSSSKTPDKPRLVVKDGSELPIENAQRKARAALANVTLTIPRSRYEAACKAIREPDGRRWGQRMYDYLQLEKVNSDANKIWAEMLYQATDAVAREMVLSVLDRDN